MGFSPFCLSGPRGMGRTSMRDSVKTPVVEARANCRSARFTGKVKGPECSREPYLLLVDYRK